MTPETLLAYYDSGQLWPGNVVFSDVEDAYQRQLAVRRLRIARGESPRGFKIGFTNRSIWPRYNVYAPIWGTVWDTTLAHCHGVATVALGASCQPRIEPEAVFGMARTPPAGATLAQLWDCLDWVAPGFEVVQSHCAGWKFAAADTVADAGLHARLLVGPQVSVRTVARDAVSFNQQLAACGVRLLCGDQPMDHGQGRAVLDSPLQALAHFLTELRRCPGGPDLVAGDVVTTGTWTDAFPVAAGQTWSAEFGTPLSRLEVTFK